MDQPKKSVFHRHEIKICVSCIRRFPCSSVPSVTHLAMSLFLWSSESNAQGESRALLKDAMSAQKALQWSETETRELLEGTEGKSDTTTRGQ